MIKIDKLIKKYPGFAVSIKDILIDKPGIYSFFGKSGSGKTTILNILGLLDINFEGNLTIFDKNIKSFSEEELLSFRRENISYIHQNPLLINELNLLENVTLNIDKNNIDYNYLSLLLERNDLLKSKKTLCKNLSGGEKQRVCFIREFLLGKKILILDEPTSNLDQKTKNDLMSQLVEYSKNHIVILVSHDYETIEKISDEIFYLNDGNIIKKIKKECKSKADSKLKLFTNDKKHLNLGFYFKYIKNLFKNRKIRNMLSFMMIFLSFISFIFIFILSDNVSSILKYNFSQYYKENEIILERQDKISNEIYKQDSVKEYEIFDLFNSYKDYIDSFSYVYTNNFDTFFKDNNELRINYKNRSQKLSKFSIQNLNEFVLTKYIKDDTYLTKKSNLKNDEIIISIDNDLLKEICSVLSIKQSFSTLFNYIKVNDLYLSFFIKNMDWQYEDEQLFKLVGFVVETENIIYHSNEFFNEYVFETMMKLPSSIYDEVYDKPWYLKKNLVINLKENGEKLFENYYIDKNLNSFVFKKASKDVFPLNYKNFNYKYLVYKNYDKFDYDIGKTLINNGYEKYYFTNVGGYMSFGNSLISGFINDIYLTSNKNNLEIIIDQITTNNNENGYFNVSTLSNSIYGGLNSIEDQTLKYKYLNDCNCELYNQIVISKELAEKLEVGIYDEIFFASKDGNGNLNDGTILISNIIDEKGYYIYGNHSWSYSFFLSVLGVDYTKLIPYSIVVTIDENENLENTLNVFRNNFKNFDVYSPLNDINKEIDSLLMMFEIILLCFCLFCSIISIVLLIFVAKTLIRECKDDITILFIFGYDKKDSIKIFKYYILFLLLSSFTLISAFSVFINYFISSVICSTLNVNYYPPFNFLYLFYLLALLLILYFFSTMYLEKELNKIEPTEVIKTI